MTRLPKPQPAESDRGVVESMGAILLIAVIALGITVFAVALFSQQAAPILPSVTFNVTYGDDGSVAIRHLGGDTIPRDQLRIYVDDGTAVHGNSDLSEVDEGESWTAWSIGDILVYEPPMPLPGPSEVLMVYADLGSGEYLLHVSEGWRGPIPVPTTEPTPTQTATPTPTLTPTPTPAPPVANFTANVTSGPAPLAVAFTDTSTGGPTSWSWDFGDGGSSTEQNPVHTYTALGTYTVSLTASNAHGADTETRVAYIDVGCPPEANFTANVTEGNAPLAVQFNDESTGNVTAWLWDFGDSNMSTVQNPVHTYESPGNYSVSLTASNAFGTSTLTKPDYIRVTKSFVNFVIDENVFIYGTALQFSGNNVVGPGATIMVTGDLDTADTNLGASIAVSDIYIDGDVTLNHGSAGLGSPEDPGSIYVNGDLELWTGTRNIYGDVYVAGNFNLKDARIHGDVYVDGNLTLDWTPWIADDARIYYTGTITAPDNYDAGILAKCIHQATVPGFTIPDQEIPTTKPADWYVSKGYVPDGELTSNLKVFADSYSSTVWRSSATNVVIIARTGDITITRMGGSTVTGVFFAPNGKVTFSGAALEGVVIARDGFFVESGGTMVTFRNLEEYITSPADYPF